MIHLSLFPGLYTHVKWFVPHGKEVPVPMAEVITPAFLFWLGVTLAGLLLSALFNEPLERVPVISRVHALLDRWKPYETLILRIGLGAGLLLQLVTGTYLAPELAADGYWVTALLILAFAGLLYPRTLIVSGAALAVLYVHALADYGLFHGLDYMFYIGIIYYLLVAQTRWRPTATPVLYLFTGLSLAWVGLEKMTLPQLAYGIMEEYQIPTFGFSMENFVLISAFIELGLAWTFIVGILNRFISLVVTLVFITTTTVFGFREIVGHTIVHTLLIMFLIEGQGVFRSPFQFHRSPVLRCLFVLVNFVVLLFGLMAIYIAMGSAASHA
ncbi:MFS family permease [Paenibacillus mucilaginosus]